MGDRANIKIREEDGGEICLYTHWEGTELPETLHSALSVRKRWDDESYLTRIIFCEMVKNNATGATGFGISTWLGDGPDRVIEVAMGSKMVHLPSGESFTFQEFVALEDPSWESKNEPVE